jgi:hypothetical protein
MFKRSVIYEDYLMKCGYDKCNKVRREGSESSILGQGIMRAGIWYCSLAHYEDQTKIDWQKKSKVDHKRKCRNLSCFNMKPSHFWDKLRKGEGFEKDGNWYCSSRCYEEDVKREWRDERDRYLSQKLEGRIHKIKFGALLMQEDIITPEQLEDALEHSKQTKKRVGESLLDLGYISEAVLTKILSRQEGIPKINLSRTTLKPNVINLISRAQAKKYKALPIEILKRTNTLIIAISDPTNKLSLIDLRYMTGYNIEPFIVPESSLISALKRYYDLEDKDFTRKKKKGKVKQVAEIKEEESSKKDLIELKNAVNIILSSIKGKGAEDFDIRLEGNTIRGSFKYGEIECSITFKKSTKS